MGVKDPKIGGISGVSDIRPGEMEEYTETYQGQSKTIKLVNFNPIINRVLNEAAFFRTHAAAVWYNFAERMTVRQKIEEIEGRLELKNCTEQAEQKVTFQNLRVFKIGRLCVIQGRTSHSLGTNRVDILQLPEDCRPAMQFGFASVGLDSAGAKVSAYAHGLVALNGLIYLVGPESTSMNYMSIDIAYITI